MWLGPSLMYLLTPLAVGTTLFCTQRSTGWSRWVCIFATTITVFQLVVVLGATAIGYSEEGPAFFAGLFGF